MVPIKRDGCLRKPDNNRAENAPCLLSSSIFNLLEVKKAISIPEKKAEKNKVIAIRIIKFIDQMYRDRMRSF